jgi:hypothetical protein
LSLAVSFGAAARRRRTEMMEREEESVGGPRVEREGRAAGLDRAGARRRGKGAVDVVAMASALVGSAAGVEASWCRR